MKRNDYAMPELNEMHFIFSNVLCGSTKPVAFDSEDSEGMPESWIEEIEDITLR